MKLFKFKVYLHTQIIEKEVLQELVIQAGIESVIIFVPIYSRVADAFNVVAFKFCQSVSLRCISIP